METSYCYLVLFQTMQIMVQWTDVPGERLAGMRPRSIQHMETCHAPGPALVLYALHCIWKLPV